VEHASGELSIDEREVSLAGRRLGAMTAVGEVDHGLIAARDVGARAIAKLMHREAQRLEIRRAHDAPEIAVAALRLEIGHGEEGDVGREQSKELVKADRVVIRIAKRLKMRALL